MSNAKLLRQLIKTGMDGDADGFKAASEAVIREEREKKHHLLANDLERLLYGERSATGRGHLRLLPAKELPMNKDSGLALVEERPTVRDETDIVLGDGAQSALDEVLMEHRAVMCCWRMGYNRPSACCFAAHLAAAKRWRPR